MDGKPPLEPPMPLWLRAVWGVRAYATWPWEAHRLKRAGWRRTGWMTWESPDD